MIYICIWSLFMASLTSCISMKEHRKIVNRAYETGVKIGMESEKQHKYTFADLQTMRMIGRVEGVTCKLENVEIIGLDNAIIQGFDITENVNIILKGKNISFKQNLNNAQNKFE